MAEHKEYEIPMKKLGKKDVIKKAQDLLYAQGLKFSRAEIAKIEVTIRQAIQDCFTENGCTEYRIPPFGKISLVNPKTRWVKLRAIESEIDEDNNCIYTRYITRTDSLTRRKSDTKGDDFYEELLNRRFMLKIEHKKEDVKKELPHVQLIDLNIKDRVATFSGFKNKEELERGYFLLTHYYRYDEARFKFSFFPGLSKTIENLYNKDFADIVEKQKQRSREYSDVYKSLLREYKQEKEESETV